MARLPTVGGDSGNWGSLLNEYLETAHNADGTLKLDVKSIADLKAINVATLVDKQQALVAGYYAPGDGGGGQFYYDAGSDDANNGGTIIEPAAGPGRWKRIYSDAVNVRWFGAKGDGLADDTAFIQATIASISNTASNGRAGGSEIRFADGDYKITSSLLIDGKNAQFTGNKTRILYAGSGPAIDVGDSGYLTNLSAGYYVFRAERIAIVLTGAAGVGIRNRGYRRVQLTQCYVSGGLVGFECEGAWSGSSIEDSVFQNQGGAGSRGVLLKQRNNLFRLKKVAVLGTVEIGYSLAPTTGEQKGILFDNCDAEGCATGYKLEGGNTGGITFLNCWGESNTLRDIQVDNETGTNKFGITVMGGVFDRGITIGVDGQTGGVDAVYVEGVEFSGGAGLDVRVQSGVVAGSNRYGGSSVLSFPNGQGYGNSFSPSGEVMLRYSSPVVPNTSNQGGNKLGDIRWVANRLFVSTGTTAPYWQTVQLEKFTGSTESLPLLESSNTPSALGVGRALTNNAAAYTITNFTDGFTGQQITIIGNSSGTTSVVHGPNIRLPGGGNITLGEYDSVTLVCRRANPALWVCSAYVNNV